MWWIGLHEACSRGIGTQAVLLLHGIIPSLFSFLLFTLAMLLLVGVSLGRPLFPFHGGGELGWDIRGSAAGSPAPRSAAIPAGGDPKGEPSYKHRACSPVPSQRVLSRREFRPLPAGGRGATAERSGRTERRAPARPARAPGSGGGAAPWRGRR